MIFVALACLLSLRIGAAALAEGSPPLTESQVKALCLLNFAKYVDWPAATFPTAGAPLTIDIFGNGEVAEILEDIVKGKSIGGHAVVIRRIKSIEDMGQAPQVLFIGAKEDQRLAQIVSKTRNLPVLTVGESAAFAEEGGMVNFVIRNSRVRFDINLNAAAGSGLRISSKLLTLADDVRGKP